MIINNKFSHGEMVHLKTDVERNDRMVTALNIRPHGITYELSLGSETSWHSDIEIEKKEYKQIGFIKT